MELAERYTYVREQIRALASGKTTDDLGIKDGDDPILDAYIFLQDCHEEARGMLRDYAAMDDMCRKFRKESEAAKLLLTDSLAQQRELYEQVTRLQQSNTEYESEYRATRVENENLRKQLKEYEGTQLVRARKLRGPFLGEGKKGNHKP